MNLRGQVFPVVDLKKRFKMLQGVMDERARVMVVEIDDQILGLVVDDVREVLRASGESYETTPAMIAEVTGQYLKGVIKVGDRLLLLLDLNRIFSIEEINEVGQILKADLETAPPA
jgi:purine-binding chemotaxis protein CheW